ncbi:hypothetical protein ACHAXR_006568 [Thalassiosira sp. AJA248-18]
MIVSIAEEMNPSRRNTMEDVHVVSGPGSWSAPNERATFLGVYDGHGGRLIADYLEDHLAENVAKEWSYSENEERKKEQSMNDGQKQQSKKRRIHGAHGAGRANTHTQSTQSKSREGEVIQTALERAFLITDVQSRMDGITTSGATVVCCVVIPNFSADGNLSSISIHAANAGDARAVLSSCTARRSLKKRKSGSNNALLSELLPSVHRGGTPAAVRITHDHKSTDPKEIARIESSGGIILRGRVLGVLAVARSLGDHGLKEYVIGRPYLSSTVIHIEERDGPEILNDDSTIKTTGEKEVSSQSSSLAGGGDGPFTDGEFLIVACDGLWDVMEDQEAVDLVRNHGRANNGKSRDKVAQFLIEKALKRGSGDNITVIVYWL